MAAAFKPSWREIERPAGTVETPAWCGDVHVDWMMDFANSPHIILKQVAPLPEFGEWAREPKGNSVRWYRQTADGSLVGQHWHNGQLTQMPDGSWETTKQDGYAGSTFTIKPVVGLGTVHLRGPWFGGTQPGYSEMTSVDMTDPQKSSPYYANRPWYKRGATFGLYISDELLIRVLSRFAPHLPLAWVSMFSGDHPRVQPYLAEWGAPKQFREKAVA
jgi:hypothetical protein